MRSFQAITKGRSRLALVGVAVAFGALVFGVVPAMAGLTVKRFAFSARNQNGTPDVQAGSHPYALTSTLVLNEPGPTNGDVKDVTVELPPGLVGNPNATPKCNYQELVKEEENNQRLCSNEAVVGIATSYLRTVGNEGVGPVSDPVYNLAPPAGVPAEFGFVAAGTTPVLLEASVRTGSDYGITESVPDVNQAVLVGASKVTIWGVPASPVHNLIRGTCARSVGGQEAPLEEVGEGLRGGEDELEGPIYLASEGRGSGLPESKGDCPSSGPLVPLLTMPVSCGRVLSASVSVDSWEDPGVFSSASVSLPGLSGCESLGFGASLGVSPETSVGSSPSGVGVGVRVPQESTENASGLGEADIRDLAVALPAGLELSDSSVDGLQACSVAEIGFLGFRELEPVGEPGVRTAQFTSGEASCPGASKIANVRVKTPLLEGELTGSLFLAAPQNFAGLPENPFSSLIAVYMVVEEPKTGVLVKLPGRVELGGQPGVVGLAAGQVRTSFENLPQFPINDAQVEVFGGERASFATPGLCGSYVSEAVFTPWSTSKVTSASSVFEVTSGPGGASCSSPLPFAPVVASQATSVNAGGFTPLSSSVSRGDGEQDVQGVSLMLPVGLTGVLAGVPVCGEVQADAGSCGGESLIGEASASAGVGGDPYTVTGGRVYLTGPYDGAPFGLSIVTVPRAGPFVLEEGRPIVVRAKLEVNPATAQVTVVTDSSGEHSIPHILDGVPLELKHLYVNVDRAGFTLNPTSCEPQSITGSVASAEGALVPVSVPFQVAGCANLGFKPVVSVSAGGHSSKKDGENLTFKISYPKGALGSEAWFRSAKVVIPKQLPSELKAIQQACPSATFEANPANCPVHSKIGEAVVHTEILSVPLTGPVYFVSYGNAKFPDVVMVLSGDNVHIHLTGETLIKNGITSVTFPSTPQVPFESIEVNLPSGEYSEFGTNLGLGNYDFCGQKIAIPTEMNAANGLQLTVDAPIQFTGCPTHITVHSTHVHHRTITLTLYIPGAGHVTVTGKHLTTRHATTSTQQLLTLTLNPPPPGPLTTHIHITYTPTHGPTQTTTTHTH